jgi:hypothetical protein
MKYFEAMKLQARAENVCPLIWTLMLQTFHQSERAFEENKIT